MDDLSEKSAAAARKLAAEMESFLESGREALSLIPKDHPMAVFMAAYLSRWETLRRGEPSEAIAEELTELGKILTTYGALKAEGEPDTTHVGRIGNLLNEGKCRLDYQETKLVMEVATKRESGPPLADTAMQALIMEMVEKKSRTEIRDALCPHNHGHDETHGESCLEKFSKQIERLKEKMKKYASPAPR